MINGQQRDYLAAKVTTASSAQLHLMLLDGALRFGREAEKGVLRGDELAYQSPLRRTLAIVGELLVSVRGNPSEVNTKLAELYAFVHRRLTSAYVNADKAHMAEALKVLAYQRETWRLACEKIAGEAAEPTAGDAASSRAPAPKPHLDAAAEPTGLSIEA